MKTYTGSSVTIRVLKADNIVSISGAGDAMTVIAPPGNPDINQTKEMLVPFGLHYFHMIGINTGLSFHIVFEIIVGGVVVDRVSESGMDQGVVLDRWFLILNSERP